MTTTPESPSFYAIIPADVRYCKKLEPSAKLLYGELTALSSKEGYCWATNRYFAELYEVDVRTITRWMASLEKEGFISTEIDRIGIQTTRRIFILPRQIKKIDTKGQNCQATGDKILRVGDKIVLHSNTSINTKSIKESSSSKPSSSFSRPPPTSDPDDASGGDDLKKVSLEEFDKNDATDVVVTKNNGVQLRMSQSVIFRHFVKFPQYSTAIVQEAIKRLRETDGTVNNILKYLESVCKDLVEKKKNSNNSFKETKNNEPRYPKRIPEPQKEIMNMGEYMKKLEEKEKTNGQK